MDRSMGENEDGTAEAHEEARVVDRRAQVLAFGALAVIALFTVFAIQNVESVEVDVLVWTVSISLIVVMLVSAVVGAIVAAAVGRRRR